MPSRSKRKSYTSKSPSTTPTSSPPTSTSISTTLPTSPNNQIQPSSDFAIKAIQRPDQLEKLVQAFKQHDNPTTLVDNHRLWQSLLRNKERSDNRLQITLWPNMETHFLDYPQINNHNNSNNSTSSGTGKIEIIEDNVDGDDNEIKVEEIMESGKEKEIIEEDEVDRQLTSEDNDVLTTQSYEIKSDIFTSQEMEEKEEFEEEELDSEGSDTPTIVPSSLSSVSASASPAKKTSKKKNKKKSKKSKSKSKQEVIALPDGDLEDDENKKAARVEGVIKMASEVHDESLKGLGIMFPSIPTIYIDHEDILEHSLTGISSVIDPGQQVSIDEGDVIEDGSITRTLDKDRPLPTSRIPSPLSFDFISSRASSPGTDDGKNVDSGNVDEKIDYEETPTQANPGSLPSMDLEVIQEPLETIEEDQEDIENTPKARPNMAFTNSPDASPILTPSELPFFSEPMTDHISEVELPHANDDERPYTPELSPAVSDNPSEPSPPAIILKTPLTTPPLGPTTDIFDDEKDGSPPRVKLPPTSSPSPPILLDQSASTFSLPKNPYDQPLLTRYSWTMTCSISPDFSKRGQPIANRIVTAPVLGSHAPSAEIYSHGLLPIFTADNLHDLFGSYKALRRRIGNATGRPLELPGQQMSITNNGLGIGFLPGDQTFHFFKFGVRPMWEDPMCEKGGKIMYAGDPATMDQMFYELILDLVGNAIEDSCPVPSGANCTILGVVISKRPKRYRLELWIGGREAPEREWTDGVEKYLSERFVGEQIYGYQAFNKSWARDVKSLGRR